MNNFPNLHQATLDQGDLESLISDIAAFGGDVQVIPKQASRQCVGDASMTLAQAHAALLNHTVQAAQIRYTYEGGRWCDTLSPEPGGWRLTRINLSEAAAS